MTTIKIAEKENKIKKNLRIKEVCNEFGNSKFYLQKKILGMWFLFDEYSFNDLPFPGQCTSYDSLDKAKVILNRYILYKVNSKKITYHNP